MGNYRIKWPYVPDYVEHHGILGMHWGDRNGPPYPLSGSEHAAVTKRGKKERAAGGSDKGSVRALKKQAKAVEKAKKKTAKSYSKQLNNLDSTYGSATSRMAGLLAGYSLYKDDYAKAKAKSKSSDDRYARRAKEYLTRTGIMEKEYEQFAKQRQKAAKETIALLNKIDSSKDYDYKSSIREKPISTDTSLKERYKSAKKKYGRKNSVNAYGPSSYYQTYIGTKYKVTSKGKNAKNRKRYGSYTPVHTTYYYV